MMPFSLSHFEQKYIADTVLPNASLRLICRTSAKTTVDQFKQQATTKNAFEYVLFAMVCPFHKKAVALFEFATLVHQIHARSASNA